MKKEKVGLEMQDVIGRTYHEFPEPTSKALNADAKVVCLCNQKGGVGKTTSVVSIAGALKNYGRRVLVIDLDPQSAASIALGVEAETLEKTALDLLIDDRYNDPENIGELIYQTTVDDIELIPANIHLTTSEAILTHNHKEIGEAQLQLANKIEPLKKDYDVILIDTQPSLGFLNINGLCAADSVIIPNAAEYFPLRGTTQLLDTIYNIRTQLNPNLKIGGIFITMLSARTTHSREVIERINDEWPDLLLYSMISRSIAFADSTVDGAPMEQLKKNHKGSKQYRMLVRELFERNVF
ncbi:MAG: AAA family ATPase [Bifidobacteriaceae bacterium]|jgi:chromosome partitioning protein|nr:AAA family ATPase [Bifidobacteriaceae bacterium]